MSFFFLIGWLRWSQVMICTFEQVTAATAKRPTQPGTSWSWRAMENSEQKFRQLPRILANNIQDTFKYRMTMTYHSWFWKKSLKSSRAGIFKPPSSNSERNWATFQRVVGRTQPPCSQANKDLPYLLRPRKVWKLLLCTSLSYVPVLIYGGSRLVRLTEIASAVSGMAPKEIDSR